MYLIRTIIGTARLMTNNEIDMEDLNIGIFKTYPCVEHIAGMV